jgi:large subunit ribosomal protein L30
VTEKTLKTIRIKWVRSGIGFTYHQKTIVRSLGLNKLNQTVVRPDTQQIRGVVASVPHLLEIVPEPVAPAWALIPEYTVHPAPPTPVEVVQEPVAAPGDGVSEGSGEPAAESHEEAAEPGIGKAPKAKAAKAKGAKKGEEEEPATAKKSKSTKGSKK